MGKKVEAFIWIGISITVLVSMILHPRVYFVLMLLFCAWEVYSLTRKEKEIPEIDMSFLGIAPEDNTQTADQKKKKSHNVVSHLIASLFALLIIWYFGNFFVPFFPYHAPYEYKSDIKQYKSKNNNYDHFPDEIPKGAKKIKWINMPSLLQGSGFEGLFFYADSDYLDDVWNRYKDQATVYSANQPAENGYAVSFPMKNYIPADTDDDLKILVLYNNGDWNHYHINGLYMNREVGYICFFCE